MNYDFKTIEKKWQDKWLKEGTFFAETNSKKPKYYVLIEFPYPSGMGLHVGHPRSYTALDIVARKRRLEGYNVLYPIGWDAFGLPTENFAIKNKIHPKKVTHDNIARFRNQLQSLGLSFDWSREVDTTDPEYYKWTQWIFLKMFERGLAYKKEMSVNFCTSCKVVLANEEVINGTCERCHSEVIRAQKSQWMLKITEYAQRLLDDLDEVDYIERVKTQQRNWIGRSTGAEVKFATSAGDELLIFEDEYNNHRLYYTTTKDFKTFGETKLLIDPGFSC
ncbi:MAG: class I tRNA ligase family protein, partial [Clostridia bacterium]|nr:class I tRNA ligase family protein [Clostridia bacterium]